MKEQGPLSRFLLLAATAMELAPLQEALQHAEPAGRHGMACDFLLCGVGPTAAAATLAGYLAGQDDRYDGVVLAGVAGAYTVACPGQEEGDGKAGPACLLDACLASREVLGDFGLASEHGAEPFALPELAAAHDFPLASPLLAKAREVLDRLGIPHRCGTFVTVNAASTTLVRGLALARRYRALCENMEGAAVALVCSRHGLPLLELRCISNLVEDRAPSRWRLDEAVRRNAEVLARLLPELASAPGRN
jgi:futalosine hydrolase